MRASASPRTGASATPPRRSQRTEPSGSRSTDAVTDAASNVPGRARGRGRLLRTDPVLGGEQRDVRQDRERIEGSGEVVLADRDDHEVRSGCVSDRANDAHLDGRLGAVGPDQAQRRARAGRSVEGAPDQRRLATTGRNRPAEERADRAGTDHEDAHAP